MAVDGCAAQGESQAAAQAFLACMKSDNDFRERVLAADPDEGPRLINAEVFDCTAAKRSRAGTGATWAALQVWCMAGATETTSWESSCSCAGSSTR